MTFGQKVKSRRKELGMTQVELAFKTNLSQGYISMLERDGFNPTALVIMRLAMGLDLSIDRLLPDDRKAG
ncbi:MAG: helix-turn-helix domain-containing protein [Ruminococcus sp.]|nr:helix-turn-helix domain-containing protein [Ruminococcus sp.]